LSILRLDCFASETHKNRQALTHYHGY
jgi:hypothetical protein